MIEELIEFTDSMLPSVSPELKDKAKAAISQFKSEGKKLNYLMYKPLDELSQGDIISSVRFTYFEETGEQKVFIADAMVISTSCHIDQKDRIILAPVFSLDTFNGDKKAVKDNIIYDCMYAPGNGMDDKYIFFGILNTYNKKLIINGLDTGRIRRLASLSQIGYYVFVIKLTIYLLRREDFGTLDKRDSSIA